MRNPSDTVPIFESKSTLSKSCASDCLYFRLSLRSLSSIRKHKYLFGPQYYKFHKWTCCHISNNLQWPQIKYCLQIVCSIDMLLTQEQHVKQCPGRVSSSGPLLLPPVNQHSRSSSLSLSLRPSQRQRLASGPNYGPCRNLEPVTGPVHISPPRALLRRGPALRNASPRPINGLAHFIPIRLTYFRGT